MLVRTSAVESELPRRARPLASRIEFAERLEPSGRDAEDVDTARLVAAIQAGQRDAAALLYARYFDRVYFYMRLALGDAHDAEDAAQQVFTSVLVALPRYEVTASPFRAWLFTIARNCALRELRRRGRAEPVAPDELDREREAASERSELSVLDWISDRELLMFVERLPEVQRQVLVLRYLLDLSTAEIAQVLDRSLVDVRSLQSRAVRFLRARLAALDRTAPLRRPLRIRRCLRQAPVLGARRWALHA
jgi:RNA polymerase sigma-70 factor (ECF subfamily)